LKNVSSGLNRLDGGKSSCATNCNWFIWNKYFIE
jgi:hypothetical protein